MSFRHIGVISEKRDQNEKAQKFIKEQLDRQRFFDKHRHEYQVESQGIVPVKSQSKKRRTASYTDRTLQDLESTLYAEIAARKAKDEEYREAFVQAKDAINDIYTRLGAFESDEEEETLDHSRTPPASASNDSSRSSRWDAETEASDDGDSAVSDN